MAFFTSAPPSTQHVGSRAASLGFGLTLFPLGHSPRGARKPARKYSCKLVSRRLRAMALEPGCFKVGDGMVCGWDGQHVQGW